MDAAKDSGPGWIQHDQDYAGITQHEIDALTRRFNLADAHTHQRQSLGPLAADGGHLDWSVLLGMNAIDEEVRRACKALVAGELRGRLHVTWQL